MSVEEKFWGQVLKTATCWNWTGCLTTGGYGDFRSDGLRIRAHRYSWELFHNRKVIKFILHKCDNRRCVRPEHLFEGSKKDNSQDAVNKGRHSSMIRSHCPSGHKYSLDNTYIHKNGSRRCKSCAANRYQRKRLQLSAVSQNAQTNG